MHCIGGILLPYLALSGIHTLQLSHMCGGDFEDDCRPQPMKAAVNPPAPTQAGEEGAPQPAASDAGPTPIMPVSAGQQHMLTF